MPSLMIVAVLATTLSSWSGRGAIPAKSDEQTASQHSESSLSGGGGEADGGQKPLEVNGQSRNLNMMLVLRNDKDKIKFVKVRENYRDEILGQSKKE